MREEPVAELTTDDPFSPTPPDEADSLRSLVRTLELAEGFTLLFAQCNQAPQRDRLIQAVKERLPNARIQEFPVFQPVENLLHALRGHLEEPPPDAVFVYGLEAWLVAPEGAPRPPFILNLNAARNNFLKDVPCPLVFWVPEHLLHAIQRNAPDFFSVRSGLYIFPATPQERESMTGTLTSVGYSDMLGLPYEEKLNRISYLKDLLHEYRSLPTDQRDVAAESRLLDALVLLYFSLGRYADAEPIILEAFLFEKQVLGREHLNVLSRMNDLASVYYRLGRYNEAEPLYEEVLQLRHRLLGEENPDTIDSMENLALTYDTQGRHEEALPLLDAAVRFNRQVLGEEHPDTLDSMNNLAVLHDRQGRHSEAEPLFKESLRLRRKLLGNEHPDTLYSMNNLAWFYFREGRYGEAEPLLRQAKEGLQKALGAEHPDVQLSARNYENLLTKMGRGVVGANASVVGLV